MSDCAPPLDASIALALLAAGRARRFGSGKLLEDLGGRPLWRWAATAAENAGFVTRIAIVRDGDRPGDALAAEGWAVQVNGAADEGIASSIRMACSAARSCRRLVIALADMPFVEPAHLRALASQGGVAFTNYPSGRNGVPAAFPQHCLITMTQLRGDEGAASLDWDEGITGITPATGHSLLDIDTAADLDRARAQIA